jgi:P-type Mg2+ transporter
VTTTVATATTELDLPQAASLPADDVFVRLATGPDGLTEDEAARRLHRYGPNAVRSHRARALPVLWRQVRSPLLRLLVVTTWSPASSASERTPPSS